MMVDVYGYIYKVTNTVNGKVYIGLTTQGFDKRYYHKGITATHNSHLRNSISEYGINAFVVDKEWDVAYTKEELDELEKYWIYIYNAQDRKYGYNVEAGGHDGKPSVQTRRKQSESRKNYYKQHPITDQQKEAISKRQQGSKNSFYGKQHTQHTKDKMSQTRTGKKKARSVGLMKPVVCITTGEKFACMGDAVKKYGLDSGSFSNLLNGRGRRKSCGSLPDGTKLKWKFYEE